MKVGLGLIGSVALSAFPDRILASPTEGLNCKFLEGCIQSRLN